MTIGEIIALIKSIPESASAAALEAADRAETAAELAEQRSFAVTEEGEEIIFTGGGN